MWLWIPPIAGSGLESPVLLISFSILVKYSSKPPGDIRKLQLFSQTQILNYSFKLYHLNTSGESAPFF